MKILFVNFEKENTMSAYNSLVLASVLIKLKVEITVLGEKGSHLEAECLKNKIPFKTLTIGEKLGIKPLPACDVVDFFSYSSFIPFMIKKNEKKTKAFFLRIFDFYSQKQLKQLLKTSHIFYKVLPASDSIKDDLVFSGFDAKKIFTFHCALNMTRWESAKLIKTAMFLKRPFKIGISYRNINEKDIDLFLNIAKKTIEELPNCDFVMIGPRHESIRDKARDMGISQKVDMLGWRTDMPEVMAMLHLFLKTQTSQSMSRSLIEAMASGVVCVVPRVKGLSDLIITENNGVLAEPGNIEEYVFTIKRLINNPPLCQTMSSLSYNYVNSNMSADSLGKLSLVLYEEALS